MQCFMCLTASSRLQNSQVRFPYLSPVVCALKDIKLYHTLFPHFSKRILKWKLLSHVWLLWPLTVHGILQARTLEWVGFPFFRESTTQGSNPGLPHCRQILYQLSHKGSPQILEWVAIPSPGDLPDSGIEPRSPALQADSLPTELSGKPKRILTGLIIPWIS